MNISSEKGWKGCGILAAFLALTAIFLPHNILHAAIFGSAILTFFGFMGFTCMAMADGGWGMNKSKQKKKHKYEEEKTPVHLSSGRKV